MSTMTAVEAAELVHVSPLTIQQWVRRGHLHPVRRNAKPARFRDTDVIACHLARKPRTWHAKMDARTEEWRAACG